MDTDILFTVRNSFYLGAFQAAQAEAADLEDGLSDDQKEERDVFVYRSYIETGIYDVSCTHWYDSERLPRRDNSEICLGCSSF